MISRTDATIDTLSLNGTWQIEIDDKTGTVQVPGVWEMQGYPHEAERAIYRREIDVPDTWQNRRIAVAFGAVSYHVEVRVNGQEVGQHIGLWTAFELDVTGAIRCGENNVIELHIIKPTDGNEGTYPFRNVLVGFTPYVSGTFGGVWQDVTLIARDFPAWQNVLVQPDWRSGSVTISATLADVPANVTAQAVIVDASGETVAETMAQLTDSGVKLTLNVTEPALWHPDHPYCYRLSLRLMHGDDVLSVSERRFGFRELGSDGDQLLLNDEPYFLRGILHWGWYPDKLAPAPTNDEIRTEFLHMRELGFNLVKLCLFVPPPNVFEIADEVGMLLWLELPLWYQVMNEHLNAQAPIEYRDIMQAHHHHPSVIIYSLGCELGADMVSPQLLGELDTIVRESIAGALVCDNSGSAEAYGGHTADLTDFYDYHFYCDLQFFKPLIDHFNRDWRPARPWIFGEFCAYDDYRDPTPLVDENGERLWWRDIYGVSGGVHRWAYSEQEARIAALDLPFDHATMSAISRRQSMAMRRYILEQTRLRHFTGGYVITGLRDTPINSSGILDDQLQFKFNPERFRQVNSASFLGLDSGRARIWNDGDQPYPLDRFNHMSGSSASFYLVYSASSQPQNGAAVRWQIERPDGTIYDQGHSPVSASMPLYQPQRVAEFTWQVPPVNAPQQWRLLASVDGDIQNEWALWVYPQLPDSFESHIARYDPAGALPGLQDLPYQTPTRDYDGILIASTWTEALADWVRDGGRCLLIQRASGGLPAQSIGFWQESLHLLHDHPVLSRFPHRGHADLQFYHLACEYALDTEQIAATMPDVHTVTPIIRRLQTRLFGVTDTLVELGIGDGTCIASTLQFEGGLGDQVNGLAANVAGRYLLHEILAYLRNT